MIIDCHFHLEERILSLPALVARMDENGIDRVALMGALVDPFPEPAPFLVKALQFLLKRPMTRKAGEKFCARFNEDGNIPLPSGHVLNFYHDPDNDPVFAAAQGNPGRFLAWVFVNPRGTKDQRIEALRWIDHPACVGVKAHSFWHRYDPVELAPAAEIAASRGKPLILHPGFGGNGDYRALLKKVPELKLILAHAGFPRYADTWKDIKGDVNIYVDLSQTSYVSGRTIRQAVEYLGVERCLYGTDGPFGYHDSNGVFDYTIMKGWIEKNFKDAGVRRRILGENFAELAGTGQD